MTKRVHILGICGTFMGGIALLARDLGYEVTGSDAKLKVVQYQKNLFQVLKKEF